MYLKSKTKSPLCERNYYKKKIQNKKKTPKARRQRLKYFLDKNIIYNHFSWWEMFNL